mgnify:CR=1 FL=1
MLFRSQDIATYSGWSIADGTPTTQTWGICSQVNDGYPFLAGTGTCKTVPDAPTIDSIVPPVRSAPNHAGPSERILS